ncbi:fibronectin type III-like domain-contianing protein, partial [Curtobacterium sp. MCBD17_030]|uniref:fibronectin type III-like domain-contianing protein n=1 Tax=Curtobacterium sp. MCBD17_030 TaxID=2175649 RepID=UPI000D85DEDB
TDSTPVRPFGFGLSYASFGYSDLVVDDSVQAGSAFTASVTVTNTGTVAGAHVVQLFGHDVAGSVTRPVVQLLGYARVELDAGESVRLAFTVPTTRLAFSDRRMVRIVEPGDVEIWVGSHAAASASVADADTATGGVIVNERATAVRVLPGTATPRAVLAVEGPVHEVTTQDARLVTWEVVG